MVNVRKDAHAMLADLESGAADLVYNVGLKDFIRMRVRGRQEQQVRHSIFAHALYRLVAGVDANPRAVDLRPAPATSAD
jgi:hypothetical protein